MNQFGIDLKLLGSKKEKAMELKSLPAALPEQAEEAANLITVSDQVFASELNIPLIHQAVTAYLAGGRAGTRAQKNRSKVKGSGSKPWRQKGTGRARAGTITSPLWRGGGVTFAAKGHQDYSQKLNKKMYRSALRSIMSELIRQKRLIIIEGFSVQQPKTRALVAKLKALNLSNVLIVIAEIDDNLLLSARNLHQVQVTNVTSLDVVSLIKNEKVLITIQALKRIEEKLL
jgi:large subunit ribosomal protein L4